MGQEKPCHDHRDCDASACCHRTTGRCIQRSHPDARRATGCGLFRVTGGRPEQWLKQPGERGFSDYVHRVLVDAHLLRTLSCNQTDPKDNWYQVVLSFLVHPHSPIQRLLVCWQLGTGKTIGMFRVLDNYFDDPRPKILVFPTRALVANFYEELERRPNRYQQWAAGRLPPQGTATQSARADALKKLLEYGTTKSKLAGPLRAFSYSQVGGQLFLSYIDTARQRAIAGAIRQRMGPGGSPLDGTIILCDEAHTILYPPDAWTAVQRGLVKAFRDRLYRARSAVVVLFTATPVVHRPTDARDMLQLVKGHEHSESVTDEGFVSWYMERPAALFAQLEPPDVCRDIRQAIISVYIDTHPGFWRVYSKRRYNIKTTPDAVQPSKTKTASPIHKPTQQQKTHKKPSMKKSVAKKATIKPVKPLVNGHGSKKQKTSLKDAIQNGHHPLASYNRPCIGDQSQPLCLRTLGRYEHVVHGRAKDETTVNHDNASETAPKLEAIAKSVADHNLRTVILIHRENGCVALVRLLQQHGLTPIFLDRVVGDNVAATNRRERENREAIQRFNAASERPDPANRVLVAVAEEYSEGVSFLNVRRIILADLSSGTNRPSWSLIKQRIARALRACSHQALPPELRTLWVSIFVAKHRQPGLAKTIDEEKLDSILSDMHAIESAMDELRGISVDGKYFTTTEALEVGRIIDPDHFIRGGPQLGLKERITGYISRKMSP